MLKIKSKIINANAGSGKTYSVVERIESIINAGHEPSTILCITFTKAAKYEMEKRLMAKGLMNEGDYLKIVTFHSLCLDIIKMFTRELDMPLDFTISETGMPEAIIEKIVQTVLLKKNSQEYVRRFKTLPQEFTNQCKIILDFYQNLKPIEERLKTLEEIFEAHLPDALKHKHALQINILKNIPIEMILSLDSKNKELPELLDISQNLSIKYNSDDIYSEKVVAEDFIKYSEKVLKITKKGEFAEYKNYLKSVIDEINNINAFHRSYMLNFVADDITLAAEYVKKQYKIYTFADLIPKALNILQNPETKQFALFKIASNIKHIIVDEAQDTNESQWRIIECLLEDLVATGMDGGSLFIVGDIKQTIYGFQGADAGIMNSTYLKYKNILEQDYLRTSYRSTKPVLDVINSMNEVFNITEKSKHISAFPENTGSVTLIKHKAQADDEVCNICNKIGELVSNLLTTHLQHPKHLGKPTECSDIAILVPKRFPKYITQLKDVFHKLGVAVSFNEKIDVTQCYCVLDFISMLKLCLFKDDKFSLYGILKSPMFLLKEEDFSKNFKKNSDFQTLRGIYLEVFTIVDELQSILNRSGISIFFASLYNKFCAKYSKTEQDILQKFIVSTRQLNQYSPIEFIQNFETSDGKIISKAQASNAITFTTVHDSKGLEFPIVIFLDVQTREHSERDPIISHKDTLLFRPSGDAKGKGILEVLAEQKQKSDYEKNRMYYVAVSRTSEHFYYICNNGQEENEKSLYPHLKNALITLNGEALNDDLFEYYKYYAQAEKNFTQEKQNMKSILVPNIKSRRLTRDAGESSGAVYGNFIHKLFENIEKNISEYEYLAEFPVENFTEILAKVKRFNENILQKIKPIRVLREQEFIYDMKVIRLDVIYFTETEVHIVDYKTQSKEITDEILNQIFEYKKAAMECYKKPVRCHIAWFSEEILEEIISA